MLRFPLVLALTLLALPAAAHATTVSLTSESFDTGKGGTVAAAVVTVDAASGERNDVTVGWDRKPGDYGPADTTIVVTDRTAPLVPGPGCTASAGAIACAVPRTWVAARAVVDLGDGDDHVTFAGPFSAIAHGGPGDDRLEAGPSITSTLDGGDGADVLVGGDGRDLLLGGASPDAISGGGGAYDIVSYADHTTGVAVRLGGSTDDGAPGEGDSIAADVEQAVGGSGDDVLVGTEGHDVLTGGLGDDRILGLGGNDVLTGGDAITFAPDADTLSGGDGDDTLSAVGRGSVLDGGAGADLLTSVGPNRVVPGAGGDYVRALGGGATVDASAPDGAADQVRCSGGAAASVVLGDGDISAGCGTHVRQRRPRALGMLPTDIDAWRTPSLVAGLDLVCADLTRPRCKVRLSVRDESTGQVLAAERLTLRPGARAGLYLPIPKRAIRDGDRIVNYVASVRAPSGKVQTVRWRAWIPGGSTAPTDGNGGRDAPSPLQALQR